VPMYAVLWWWFAGLATPWEQSTTPRLAPVRVAA
jgi:hypothetical protein